MAFWHTIGLDKNDIYPILRENRDEEMHAVPYMMTEMMERAIDKSLPIYTSTEALYISLHVFNMTISLDVCNMYF